MNERIQHLSDIAYKNHLKNNPHSSFGRRADYDREFAQLIVRECLKEIKDMIVDESELLYPNNKQTTEYVNERLLDAYDNISEHFGVEE